MAFGNLKFDTLTTSDSIVTNTEKSINTSYVLNGSAKVWQRHNASHTLASGSLNCSSVTDTATGIATITYTNALSAATQVVVAGSGNENDNVSHKCLCCRKHCRCCTYYNYTQIYSR